MIITGSVARTTPRRSFISVRSGMAAWLSAVGATVLGIALNATAALMPGSEPLGTEDVVDAVAGVLLGGLGLLLLRRRRAAGLGVGLIASSVAHGLVWLTGSALPDLIIGTLIALLVASGAWRILRLP